MSPAYHKGPVLARYDENVKRALEDGTLPGRSLLLPEPDTRCPDWWRDSTEQSIKQREMMERGFATLTKTTMNGSRTTAEQCTYHKDLMMLKYLYYFPLNNWLIPSQEARLAFDTFIARESLRRQDSSIYDKGTTDSWWFAETSISATQPKSSTGVPAQIEANALSTTASSGPDALKLAEGKRHLDFAMEVIFALLEREISMRNAPPQAINDKYEASFSVDELPQNVNHPAPKRSPDSAGSTTSRKVRKKRKIANKALPYAKNVVPTCLWDSLSVSGQQRVERHNDQFPWSQHWAISTPSKWDHSVYPPERSKEQEKIHERNSALVKRYEADTVAKRQSYRSKPPQEGKIEAEDTRDADGEKVDEVVADDDDQKKDNQPASQNAGGKHSRLCLKFSDETSESKCKEITGCETVDEAIQSILKDHPDMVQDIKLSEIKIHFGPRNPSSKGLQPFHFSLLDSIYTRIQMSSSDGISLLEAHRIVDFAPDLLFGGLVLVRVLSDGTLSNTVLRNRLMLNGCYIEGKVLSKRLSSALGGDMLNNFRIRNKDKEESIAEIRQWYGLNQRRFKHFQTFHKQRASKLNKLQMERDVTGFERTGVMAVMQEVGEETEVAADEFEEEMNER